MVWLEAKKPTTCGKLDSVSRWLPHSLSAGWPRARLFRIENCWTVVYPAKLDFRVNRKLELEGLRGANKKGPATSSPAEFSG